MDEFGPARSDFHPYRDGFAVAVWTNRDRVVGRARPDHVDEPEPVPAIPTRARIVVWEPRRGMLRDRIRAPSPWRRLVAWLRHTSVPTTEEQISLLAEELLTAIDRAEPSADSWAETRRGDTPPTARPRVVATFDEPRRGLLSRIARFGGFAAIVLALGVAAAFALWRTASGDVNNDPILLAEDSATTEPVAQDEERDTGIALSTPTPAAGASEAATDADAETDPDAEPATPAVEHVVVSGDTLAAIASRFGVTVEELRAENALASGDPIYPGQVLRIP